MMVLRFLIIVAFLTGCTNGPTEKPQGISAEQAYQQQLALTQLDPTLAHFVELKQRYIATPYANEPIALTMLDADLMLITTEDHHACLEQAQQILNDHYVNINAHFAAMACAYNTGTAKQAQQSEMALNQLLAVIWESGNGETALQAFQVLDLAEIRSFVHLHGLAVDDITQLSSTPPLLYRLTLINEATQTRFQWFFKTLTLP